MPSTEKTGYVRKSHAGMPFEKHSVRRYCASNGFQVVYGKNEHNTTGRFDLRQVERLSAVQHDEARGVHIKVRDRGSKALVVVFTEGDADEWLHLWCSAVDAAALSEELSGMRDPALAEAMNVQYGKQAALKAKSSGYASAETVFSPRIHIPHAHTPAAPTPRGDNALPPPPAPLRLSYNNPDTDNTGGGPGGGNGGASPLSDGNDGDDDADVFIVTVPEGCRPGDKLRVTDGTGAKLIIEVPEGAGPGAQLEYVRPLMDGSAGPPSGIDRARAPSGAAGPLSGIEAAAPSDETDEAPDGSDGERDQGWAAPAPGTARGAGGDTPGAAEAAPARAAGWMRCLPPVNNCLPPVNNCIPGKASRRSQQFEAALAAGDLKLASELSEGDDEIDRLRAAREREAAFVAAIRAYDWARAKALAENQRELDDLHDSILRVKFLDYYIEHGQTEKALELAITQAEVERVRGGQTAR
jgi:hypothetical protein